jgi:hypothetical protein
MDKSILSTRIPDFEINKQDLYTIDYIEKTNGVCKVVKYNDIEEYKKKYAVITSYEELKKYLPEDDQVLHDTGKYIMNYHKKGIYVSIKNNKLKYFLVLNKENYIAPYQKNIQIHPKNKYDKQNAKFRLTNCLLRIINKKHEFKEIDFYIMEILYFIKNLVNSTSRTIPDCNFYINYKDQLLIHKINDKYYTPFPDVFGNMLLEDEWQNCKLGRLFSICHAKNYSDLSFVAPDDIIRINKLYSTDDNKCVNSYKYNEESANIKWEDKKPIAFFRGTSTGCGNDIYTNQRIKLAYLDTKWNEDTNNDIILDAKIVRWAFRLKKTQKDKMFDRINDKKLNEMGIKLGNKVPIDELFKYKYLINVDGNVAAYRLGFLFSLNAVVFIVEGKYKLWFQDKLIENNHYIKIKSDLSDLKEKIYWCKRHDAECKKIAENAVKFYKETFTNDNMYNYMIEMMNKMNSTVKY